jgi:DinB superfamily
VNTREAIKAAYAIPDQICRGYLKDLTDADLMKRPVPGSNHIAWQLGHLIESENSMVNQVCPGVMPTLPAGFGEKHNKTTATSDDASKFLKKNEYLELYDATRRGTLKAIDSLSDSDLDKPSPESVRQFVPTVASLFLMQPTHWMMHAGQWAVVRRSLGKPPLF